ncbi:hypothetical protein PMSD_10970 [Paenibacillus macquariensis subsp. defensor]|uniref:Uncharacterized protein n=1 Tax=Paenibacillus macquariensis TaxID=948756 RepID=A0ABY1K923_9BACL|nr:hypothetical protein [Paenibacillus macquariensis]MEC0091529.1 hypothetical protein [Paenibacillus macquariensis]OAB26661.1 hypothetical protein PMSM_26195 [Paenibacillus macquariensis subsp. macquariensis]OAB36824.1 hypothetical protein PMSD_10970 [Paenibacillus macquariensis subsp. defensor]SIR44173.1 hypothetical protein SAMN05421578_11435 [Paenibacillus macquariensis]
MKECLVHFQVKHKAELKHLRGLIFLNENQQPGNEQLIEMFKDMDYVVVLSDPNSLVFKPVDPSADYESIRITELDMGEEKYTEDRDLKTILSNFL